MNLWKWNQNAQWLIKLDCDRTIPPDPGGAMMFSASNTLVYFNGSWLVESLLSVCLCRCSAASGEHLQHSGSSRSHHHSDVLWPCQTEGGDRRARKLHLLRPEQWGLGRPAHSQYHKRLLQPRTWINPPLKIVQYKVVVSSCLSDKKHIEQLSSLCFF